jgi:hypothetical protein
MADTQCFRRLHFSLKDRLVSLMRDRLFGSLTYAARHGRNKGIKRKGDLSFLLAISFALLRRIPKQPSCKALISGGGWLL